MTDLPRIGAPATRALAAAGITSLEDVAGRSSSELLALHGVGPKAIRLLSDALEELGLDELDA
ncbi:MAG: helix-hairpin-helix domain-containing protein [Candidatus Nanopelagicales bacterium]